MNLSAWSCDGGTDVFVLKSMCCSFDGFDCFLGLSHLQTTSVPTAVLLSLCRSQKSLKERSKATACLHPQSSLKISKSIFDSNSGEIIYLAAHLVVKYIFRNI